MRAAPDLAQRRALAAALARPALVSVRTSGLLAGGLFLSLGVLACIAPLKSGVIAQGLLIADGNRQKVEHPLGGVVTRILVHEGDAVAEGQSLVELEGIEARAEARALGEAIATLEAEVAALEALLAGAGQIVFPQELGAGLSTDRADAIRMAQHEAFAASRAEAEARKSQLWARTLELRAQIAANEARIDGRENEIRLMRRERDALQPLVEKGLVTRPRVLALERAIAERDGEARALAADIIKLQAEIGRVEVQLASIEVERRAEAAERLRVARSDLAAKLEEVEGAKSRLGRGSVKAPVGGRVVGLEVNTIGEVVSAGEKLMDIVPSASELVVSARIAPQYRDDVRAGMPAVVRFESVAGLGTTHLQGFVRDMSADARTDARTDQPFFEVHVAISAVEAQRLAPGVLAPGLPATVLLESGERTALEYIVAPLARGLFSAAREP